MRRLRECREGRIRSLDVTQKQSGAAWGHGSCKSQVANDTGLTVIWGCLILVFLPDSPMRAKCFDEETKTLILERLRVNELGVQDKRFKWEQLREGMSPAYLEDTLAYTFSLQRPSRLAIPPHAVHLLPHCWFPRCILQHHRQRSGLLGTPDTALEPRSRRLECLDLHQ